MISLQDLKNKIFQIDRKGYKAYKDIQGVYQGNDYTLYIDHVQGDPFASPSRLRIKLLQSKASFPEDIFSSKSRKIALRDYITRKFHYSIKKFSKGARGSGKSGIISIDNPGQEILQRTSCFIDKNILEVRFTMGLPALGRRVAAKHADEMLFEELPQIMNASLFYKNLDKLEIYEHIETAEDADFLRNELEKLNLIAFIADGSILPRSSGIDPTPKGQNVIPFMSPESMRVQINLPNQGKITGMGIQKGVTLITGGGYHGKSTLLNAIELGVYNHIPKDGRELVVTHPRAFKIRAEDGRYIENVDISPFIYNLPFNRGTRDFSSEDASGSTSQAANILEALEIGAKVLLIDEDTSATNFMVRDHRMQELVSKDKEPITPFIDKVKQLYKDYAVSTILVIGGSGDYFDVADKIICMEEYLPQDRTEDAIKIRKKYRLERKSEGGEYFGDITERIPVAKSFDPAKGKRRVKISPKGPSTILFGKYQIKLSALEQLVDTGQTRAIGDAIYYSIRLMDGKRTLKKIIDMVIDKINSDGLDSLNNKPMGDYAIFRGLEMAGAINRLRTLKVKQYNKKTINIDLRR